MTMKRMLMNQLEKDNDQVLSLFIEVMVNDYGLEEDKIEKLINSDADFIIKEQDGVHYVRVKKKGKSWYGFSVLSKPQKKEHEHHIPPKETYIDSPIMVGKKELKSTHMEMILWASENNENVLLVGPPGCGKTSILRSICSNTNRSFRRVNLARGTTVEDIVGRWTLVGGETVWVDGPLLMAIKKGWWFCCDEINASSPDVLFILRPLLDEQRQLILTDKHGEVITPHKDFRFFGTMNPASDPVNTGIHDLGEADMDRFGIVIPMGYLSPELEQKVVLEKSNFYDAKLVEKMVRAANMVRNMRKQAETLSLISTRRLIKWAKACLENDLWTAYEVTIGSKLRVEEQDGIRDAISGLF